MEFGFWKQLEVPFNLLAPMSGVTDAAFREIIAKYGKPDGIWTEFVPADGLCSPGRNHLLNDLIKSNEERPVVAQIYGANPANFRDAASLIARLGFDGVDINMGCPAKPVEKRGGGAGLIRNAELARQLIEAAQEGAKDIPVSVKTRIGYSQDETETWIAGLIKAQPAAIIIHARTRDEMSKVPARWDAVSKAVELASSLFTDKASRPLIVGNGDVTSLAQARARANEAGCDGVMVGRGIFGDPWFFNSQVQRSSIPIAQILDVMLEHTESYRRQFEGIKPLEVMKKHFKAYVSGFRGAGELREQLMEAEDYEQIQELTRNSAVYSAAQV